MFTDDLTKLLNSIDELKSMENQEIDFIKRGLSQLELILEMKEQQLIESNRQIETYKATIEILDRRLSRVCELNSQLVKEREKSKRTTTF